MQGKKSLFEGMVTGTYHLIASINTYVVQEFCIRSRVKK